ncbi:MAG TPA: phosphoglucosamine mutase [Firmicutes bacterium]|nr:phosphoglucosamine mutase [Bacillota bacterium]
MGKLFGTDGIRGVANRELTPELAFKIGRIGAFVLQKENRGRKAFLVARDTRKSGTMLESALVAGLNSAGVDVYLAGVISTPATAYLTKQLAGCGGVVISASHNPYYDNGIKFFSPDGFKLPDAVEAEMEELFFQADDSLPRPEGEAVGCVLPDPGAAERYLSYLLSTVPCRLEGCRIVLDCANGAVSQLAPQAFRALGAEVIAFNNRPDGININACCGSTHPEAIVNYVKQEGADFGFTFDGDADRVLAVDAGGQLVDGDAIMMILARHLLSRDALPHRTVVATVMSNLGLEKAAETYGFRLLRTKVGDRYVLEEMLAGGYTLGGEQSGHIILLDYNTTGDGLLTALQVAAIAVAGGKNLKELASGFTRYPQVLVNCRVKEREGWESNPRIRAAIAETEETVRGSGRLLIRPSGTEPLIRVMLEGQDEEKLRNMAARLAEIIAAELNR